MAERTGNWFTGYSGQSTYIPSSYQWGGSMQGEYGFRPGNQYDPLSVQGLSLGEMMMRRARGDGPSAAELSMMRAVQGMRGAMAGIPGMSPALAARLAGQQASGMVGQQALLRAQEQAQAQQSLADYLMQQLGIRAQGATTREQLLAQTKMERERMLMEQDLANARGMSSGGMLGGLLGAISGLGSFASTMKDWSDATSSKSKR